MTEPYYNEPSANSGDDSHISGEEFEKILAQLDDSIARERLLALAASMIAVLFGWWAMWFLPITTSRGLEHIHRAAESVHPGELAATTIYVIIRGSALAAIIAGLLFALIKLARSALDQATRFDKRLIAAHFINFAVHTKAVDAKKMEIALRVLEAWGASVDSAYTPNKVAAARPEKMRFSLGRRGASVDYSPGVHD